MASGFTSYEGGGISYNIPYAKRVTLEKSIRDWQYCDRLMGMYEEHGIRINREPFGPLTGTLNTAVYLALYRDNRRLAGTGTGCEIYHRWLWPGRQPDAGCCGDPVSA
ncbi:hypothetical protein ACLB1E_28530 [Escherichia coli]